MPKRSSLSRASLPLIEVLGVSHSWDEWLHEEMKVLTSSSD